MAAGEMAVRDRDVSIGRVFERAFAVIRHNVAATVGLAFLLGAIPGILTTLLFTDIRSDLLAPGGLGANTIYAFMLLSVLSWIVALIVFALTLAGLTRVTVAHAEGDRATFGESLMAGMSVLPPLIGLALLFALGVMAGFMLLIVPGIILYLMWSVAVPALVEEQDGVFAALGRSNELTKGAKWKIFAIVLMLVVLYYLLSGAVSLLAFSTMDFESAAETGAFDLPLGFIAGNIVVGTLINLIWGTVQASLYVELRDWKDGPGADRLEDVFA